MRRRLELLVDPGLPPRRSVAADALLLASVHRLTPPAIGVLRVSELTGTVLSLGRFHLVPRLVTDVGETALLRRLTGGRAVPAGEGFVGVSLALAHRSALVADDPLALSPPQVLNRCVRGILEACAVAGTSAFYPGRDLITADGRILGCISLEVTAGGACLFEAIVASGREMSLLPLLLDRLDPEGVVRGGLLLPGETTSLARLLGRPPRLAQVAEWLARGYATRFDLEIVPRGLTPEEERTIQAGADAEFADERWLGARLPRADLDRRVAVASQLGTLEVHLSIAHGRIRDAVLAGDFIADAGSVARLEAALRGCPVEVEAIDAVVTRVLAEPGSYLLGVHPPRAIAEAIGRECGA